MEFDEFFKSMQKKDLMQSKELLEALSEISNMCIGEIAMNYKVDAQAVGELIYKATGLTNAELNDCVEIINRPKTQNCRSKEL